MVLIQPLLSGVPSQVWRSLAGALNEKPEHVRQGLADALPLVFAAAIAKASTVDGATSLLDAMLATDIDLTRFEAVNDNNLAKSDILKQGAAIARSVLGDRYSKAAGAIAKHAGVAIPSAHALLGLAAPLALSGIARAAPTNGYTAESLRRFLRRQRGDVAATAPLGLPPGLVSTRVGARRTQAAESLPWLMWTGAAAVLALSLGHTMIQRVTPTRFSTAPPSVHFIQQPSAINLPGGARLETAPGSIDYGVAAFLRGSAPAPRTFTFDDLHFDAGELALTAEASATLDNLAMVLNAYPRAKIRLEGYAGAASGIESLIRVSANANAVARALVARGVKPDRLSTAAFGPENGIRFSAEDHGRDTPLDLVVVAK